MKSIPNLISTLRIILSLVLLSTTPFDAAFYILYLLSGASDMLDGFLARKLQAQSHAGAVLDSIGDIVFCGAALILLLPVISLSASIVIWIACIAAVKLISILIGIIKYRKAALLHTYLNELTGLILFILPLIYGAIKANWLITIFCMIATVSATEELLIHITSKKLNRNTKGLLIK